MDYKIVEKDLFTVMGVSKVFKYDSATTEIPKLWTEHYQKGNGKYVCGMYGICIDESMGANELSHLQDINLDADVNLMPVDRWII